MAISADSVIILENQIFTAADTYSTQVLGYCNESTTDYTNSGINLDDFDPTNYASGIIIFYFLSSNSAAAIFNALVEAESVSGSYEDTTCGMILQFASIEAGSFNYDDNTYAYKLTSSSYSGAQTDNIEINDLITLDLVAINSSAQQVADEYITQLESSAHTPLPNSKLIEYSYSTQLLSDLTQLIPS